MSKFTRFCFMLLIAAITVVPAQAGIIHDLIGDQSLAPLAVGLDNPANAVNVDGMLHVTGFSDGIGARQVIDLTTGTAGPIQQFYSLNGLGGSTGINEVILLNDGSLLYVGNSALGANPISPTYWLNGVDNPVGVEPNPLHGGGIEGSSGNGVMVGVSGPGAVVTQLGGTTQPLPGGNSQIARDITADARYIVGDSIWMLGDDGYQTVNTLGFEAPTNGTLPTQWGGVAIDPLTGQAVLTGSYVDLDTFQTNTGFWSEDGTLLGTFGGLFEDFEIWEGQLVAGLNGLDGDGHLLAISDFSTASIFDLTGQTSMLRENGLFVGSAGFLLDGPGGPVVTAYSTHDVTAVPEPSSLLLWLVGGLMLWINRNFGWSLAR